MHLQQQFHRHLPTLNPEPTVAEVVITSGAIVGALEGALVGGFFTKEAWYHGVWKGALAGAVAMAGVAALVNAAGKSDEYMMLGTAAPLCDPSIGSIAKDTLSAAGMVAIPAAAAGAVVGAGHRGDVAIRGAAWAAVLFGGLTAIFESMRKFRTPSDCV